MPAPDPGLHGAARLTKKAAADKRIAITVFSFPPDKGNVGTAAYLNVFGSIFRVLQDLQAEGYNVGELPEDETALMQKVWPASVTCMLPLMLARQRACSQLPPVACPGMLGVPSTYHFLCMMNCRCFHSKHLGSAVHDRRYTHCGG